MSIPVNKLGWMAGVLDLRGKITRKSNKARNTAQVVLYVESKHYHVIRELGSLTGTKPELKKPDSIKEWLRKGCSEHCPEAHIHVLGESQENFPPTARWTATGAAAAVILHNVMPYILSQYVWQTTLDDLIEGAVLEGQGSGATIASIRRLHELGWDIPEQFQRILDTKETNA